MTTTKTINAHCYIQGTLRVGTKNQTYKGFDESGSLAAYEFDSPNALHQKASSYKWVLRPGKSKAMLGFRYTLKMAANDFKNHSS